MRIDLIMPTIEKRLATIKADATFNQAAQLFADGDRELVIVCNERGVAIGVVTRTDAMRHLARDANPLGAAIAQLMSHNIVACRRSDDMLETWRVMNAEKLGNLPVLDDEGTPIGVLSAGNALEALLAFEQYQELVLVDYIAGIGYR